MALIVDGGWVDYAPKMVALSGLLSFVGERGDVFLLPEEEA